jgi:hypothetical protein
VDTDVSEEHTDSIIRIEVYRVLNWLHYTGNSVFLPITENNIVALKRAIFLFTVHIGLDQALLSYSLPLGCVAFFLEPSYTAGPLSQYSDFNTEDGGSVFLRNAGILLEHDTT